MKNVVCTGSARVLEVHAHEPGKSHVKSTVKYSEKYFIKSMTATSQ